jgi:ketosteroid isomerase-like protein
MDYVWGVVMQKIPSFWMRCGVMGAIASSLVSLPSASVAQPSPVTFLRQMEAAFKSLDANQLILFYARNAEITRINNSLSVTGANAILDRFTLELLAFQHLTLQYGEAQIIPLANSQMLVYAPFSVMGTSTSGSDVQFDGASTFVLTLVANQWQIVREHSSAPFLI